MAPRERDKTEREKEMERVAAESASKGDANEVEDLNVQGEARATAESTDNEVTAQVSTIAGDEQVEVSFAPLTGTSYVTVTDGEGNHREVRAGDRVSRSFFDGYLAEKKDRNGSKLVYAKEVK